MAAGVIETPRDEADARSLNAQVPPGRPGRPNDVAALVSWQPPARRLRFRRLGPGQNLLMAMQRGHQELPGPLNRFRCAHCGYGVSRAEPPHRCPMCAGVAWAVEMRPSASLLVDLNVRPGVRADTSSVAHR